MMNHIGKARFRFALKFSITHLLITAFVASLLAIVVFRFWYPEPFADIAGGLGLYKLIIIIDVICGPLLTFVLFSPTKSKKALLTDIVLIVIIQLSALGYGLYNVYQVRPLAVVFELDRFRIVDSKTIYNKERQKALPEYRKTPLWGIYEVGVKRASNTAERNKNMNLSLKGIEMGMRPELWKPYGQVKNNVIRAYKPISSLKGLSLGDKQRLSESIAKTKVEKSQLFYLPIAESVTGEWIVLLNKKADIVGYANVNGW